MHQRRRVRMRLERLWDMARQYAKENNLEYVSTYGVVGVAPT